MNPDSSARVLSDVEVLVVDCQATAAAPRGHLLEIGWARCGATITDARACLIALPEGERVPPAVTRITGIDNRMMRAGVEPDAAWRALAHGIEALSTRPVPTVIHFARFEEPFLRWLAGGGPSSLDVVCTHAIAARVLPGLPRRSLRALAGYFGRSVGALRRSADHVEATAFVWRELLPLLEQQGVSTWSDLKAWLAMPVGAPARRRRVFPMPREVRLALPDAPGIYRMLRTSGDVLYVGKAASLRERVNSYFRHQRGVPERMLEMLSQARAISFEVSASPLEAALLEPDEIKRFRPPYNIALADVGRGARAGARIGARGERQIWFAAPDLIEHSPHRSQRCPIGPFPAADTLQQFAALVEKRREALGRDRWAPQATVFEQGYARFCAAHAELRLDRAWVSARLLRLGTRLWREGRRDRDADEDEANATDGRVAEWTPDNVQRSLEWLAIRAALATRRATWLTRLVDASIAWREPGAGDARLVVIENGDVVVCTSGDPSLTPPIPPGYARSAAARRDAFTVARFDRLRVLTTELKRLIAARALVAVRFGASPPLDSPRLAAVLAWL